jgi:hypothetical protein
MNCATTKKNRLEQYARRARSTETLKTLNSRVGDWTSFAMAAGSAAAFATSASAGIIHSGPINYTATAPSITGGADDDQFTIGGVNFAVRASHFFAAGQLFTSDMARVQFRGLGSNAGVFLGPNAFLKAFQSGSLIGSDFAAQIGSARERFSFYSDSSSFLRVRGDWADNNPRLAGFFMSVYDQQLHQNRRLNGWIRLAVGFDGAEPRSISALEWAYEDSGAMIAAGDTGLSGVPEPGTESLAMLALGAGAVMGLRRRRQALNNSSASQ